MSTDRTPTYEEAIAAAGAVIARDLAQQARRPAPEAARLAIGRDATPEQIDAWIARFRPEHVQRPS